MGLASTASMVEELRKRLGLERCRRIAAMIGAPNAGKSTLFNALTGGRAKVGNWPGVTVDLHVGRLNGDCIVDLPGVYGLGSGSLDERVAKEAIARLHPDKLVVVVDATAPERGLFLLVNALEAFKGEVIVAITKYALAHGMGIHIDVEGMKARLGVPVVVTSALEGIGVEELRRALQEHVPRRRILRVDYGLAEEAVERLASTREASRLEEATGLSARWLAAQLIAGDPDVERMALEAGLQGLVEEAERAREELRSFTGLDPALLIVEARVRLAEEVARSHIVRRTPVKAPGWLDRLLLHPVAGPLASLAIIFTVFLTAFTVNTGFPLNVILDWLGLHGAAAALEEYSLGGLIARLFEWLSTLIPEGASWAGLAHGVLDGVGLVASFIPLIAALVALMSLLDDSGLLTRMAVSFHPLFKRFGLTGRSLYPLVTGLGCNVPAVMLTRTLSPEEKLRAIFAIPFIPCSARLVIITAFAYAFFTGPLERALAATGIYAIAIAVALLSARLVAWIQGRRLGVEEEPELVMELPLVHKPSPRVVWWATRDALAAFLRKMAGPILLGAVVIWALLNYGPGGAAEDYSQSYGAMIGRAIGVILEPLGIGGDAASILGLGLLAGALVKEVFVETIGVAVGAADPTVAVAALGLTKAQAFAVLVFATLYVPCIGTASAVYGETRSARLTAALVAYMIAVALIAAYAGYAIHVLLDSLLA